MAELTVAPPDLEVPNILLNHVVLPRVLPQEKSRFIHEREIVMQLVETVENVSERLPMETVEMMDRLKRVTREYTGGVVSEIINELEPGDSFSMFVRRQNTTIMFYIPKAGDNTTEEPQNIIVATFMGTLHPREIFKHESDIEVSRAQFGILKIISLQMPKYRNKCNFSISFIPIPRNSSSSTQCKRSK